MAWTVHLLRSPWSTRPVCRKGWRLKAYYLDPRFPRPRLTLKRYCRACIAQWDRAKAGNPHPLDEKFYLPPEGQPNQSQRIR